MDALRRGEDVDTTLRPRTLDEFAAKICDKLGLDRQRMAEAQIRRQHRLARREEITKLRARP